MPRVRLSKLVIACVQYAVALTQASVARCRATVPLTCLYVQVRGTVVMRECRDGGSGCF